MALPTPLCMRIWPLHLSTESGRRTDGELDLALVFVFLKGIWKNSFM